MSKIFKRIKDGINLGSLTSDPIAAKAGDFYYNLTSNTFRGYNGTTWENLATEDFVNTQIGNIDFPVDSVNGQTDVVVLDTDDIAEGTTNQYYTTARVQNDATKRNLSNLISPTAINQNLLPDGAGRTIGDVGSEFNSVFAESIVTDAIYDLTLSPRVLVSTDETIITSKNNAGIILNPDGTGNVGVSNSQITDVVDPTSPQHAATKNYVDTGLSAKIDSTEKGQPLGVATLDGGGKVPLTQLPAAIMTYEGVWNAATNTPTLIDGVGDSGMVYRVGTAGTQDLGSGPITFDVGDYVIYNGTVWEKSDTTDAVASVNGFTGIVNLDTDDISEGTTNLYFTNSRVLAALPQDIATTATPQFQDAQVIGPGLGNRLVGRTLALASSTGVISGMVLSVNAGDPSKFDLSAGTGEVVDLTNIASPVVTPVTFPGATAVSVTNLLTSEVTYISVDSSGNIYQQTTYPTPVERRQRMFVGRLNHSDNVTINFANTFPDYKLSFVSQYYDLLDALAPFKIGGLTVTPNGANLNFNKASGSVFFRSNNYSVNNQNPHISTFAGQIPQAFRKITRLDTVDLVDTTIVDPANYDNAGVVTAVGGGTGRSTIQRIFQYKSGAVRIAYGQNVYNTLSDALAAINSDSFVPNPTIEQTAILLGYIVVRHGATDLSDPAQARIITAARFDAGGSAAAGGVTSLQQAYNNSTLPQIILSAALGAFTIDDNATPLGTDLFQVRSNTGVDHFAVSAAKTVVSNTLQIPTGAVNGRVLTSDATGNASWQDAASSLQDVYDNSAPPTINLTPNGPIEIFDPGVAGGTALSVTTTGGAFEVRDSELSYTGPNVLLNDTSIKGVKNPIEWDNATNRDYVDNRSNTNFILNGTSESGADGWMTYADAAASRPVDGTGGSPTISFLPYAVGPLSGNVSFLLDKPSGNRQGQGVSYDFTIDSASQAKVLKISFDYAVATGTFVAGTNTTDSDVIVYLYDITNARLIEPSSIKLLSNATSPSDTFQSTFQTSPDSVNYRLIFHIATSAGAPWALKIDNVKVERSQYVYGTPITDWQSYTSTISVASGTFPTNTQSFYYRKVGDSIEVKFKITFTGTGTWAAPTFSLPPGLTIDATKLVLDGTGAIGHATLVDTGVAGYAGVVGRATENNAFRVFPHQIVTATTGQPINASSTISQAIPFTWSSTDIIEGYLSAPIQGWSSSVQVSDGYDARPIAGAAYRVTTNQTGVNPNNSQVKVQINGLGVNNLDTVSGFDFTNNRYLVKTAGIYDIDAAIHVAGTNVVVADYILRVVVSGITNYTLDAFVPQASTGFVVKGSLSLPLNAGDYVEVFLFSTANHSTNTLTVQTGNSTRLLISKQQAPTTISMTETVAFLATGTNAPTVSGTPTDVVYLTKQTDTHNAYNTTTGVYTIPVSGIYDIFAVAGYGGVVTPTNVRAYIEININGSAFGGGRVVGNGAANEYFPQVTVDGITLKAGDQIKVRFENSGITTTLSATGGSSRFSVKMVK